MVERCGKGSNFVVPTNINGEVKFPHRQLCAIVPKLVNKTLNKE
jgi:hypothetical protein